MIVQDRNSSRRFFLEVWEKHRAGGSLQPLEELVLEVLLEHPEYHGLLGGDEEALSREFTPGSGDANPFLHMGMHIAIREQVQSNRPAGITPVYRQLLATRFTNAHDLEHRIMECLGAALWTAQRNNTLPDEADYLDCIKRIL